MNVAANDNKEMPANEEVTPDTNVHGDKRPEDPEKKELDIDGKVEAGNKHRGRKRKLKNSRKVRCHSHLLASIS